MDNPHRDPMRNHFARQAWDAEVERHRSKHWVLIFGILAGVVTAVGIGSLLLAANAITLSRLVSRNGPVPGFVGAFETIDGRPSAIANSVWLIPPER
jgi:hypothetical protein